jgi:hypothetical protein
MQRWSSCQSRFKTRNSFAILLFASLNGTFRSMAYYQTIFAGNLTHRPSFQIFNWTIFGEDTVWKAASVHITTMIGNSKIVLQMDLYPLSRTVSFHCLHFNSVCLLKVYMMVVLDFILDSFQWRYIMKCQIGAHAPDCVMKPLRYRMGESMDKMSWSAYFIVSVLRWYDSTVEDIFHCTYRTSITLTCDSTVQYELVRT